MASLIDEVSVEHEIEPIALGALKDATYKVRPDHKFSHGKYLILRDGALARSEGEMTLGGNLLISTPNRAIGTIKIPAHYVKRCALRQKRAERQFRRCSRGLGYGFGSQPK